MRGNCFGEAEEVHIKFDPFLSMIMQETSRSQTNKFLEFITRHKTNVCSMIAKQFYHCEVPLGPVDATGANKVPPATENLF